MKRLIMTLTLWTLVASLVGACYPPAESGVVTPPGAVETAAAPVGGGAGQLVFDSYRGGKASTDLYIIASDGTGEQRLTQNDGEGSNAYGSWSPDGTRVVYSCWTHDTTDICIANGDGTGQVNLTNTPSSSEYTPAWAPDGAHIAFSARDLASNDIYLMDADGSNWQRLTSSPAAELYPAWSPDGSQIAFASNPDEYDRYDIYIMQSDGSGVRRLTSGPNSNWPPSWSPDGSRIAFMSSQGSMGDIWVTDVDGSNLHNLTGDPADDEWPAWSPDGAWIAFQSYRDGNADIYLMRADGTQVTNLTNLSTGGNWHPNWRPLPAAVPIATATQPLPLETVPGQQGSALTPPAEAPPAVTITATQIITVTPGPPTGEPREGRCLGSSLVVWREGAWQCIGADPCFSVEGRDDVVICPEPSTITSTVSFTLTLTEPLPAPWVPENPAGHAWELELADGTRCGAAHGTVFVVEEEQGKYWCTSPDPNPYPGASVVVLGDLRPGVVYRAHRAVIAGSPYYPLVLESAEIPVRTLWR